MAFTLTLRIAGRSFQLVRQPLLLDDELPFADQLTVEQTNSPSSRSKRPFELKATHSMTMIPRTTTTQSIPCQLSCGPFFRK